MRINTKAYIILIIFVIILILGVIVLSLAAGNPTSNSSVPNHGVEASSNIQVKIPSIVEETESISCDTIQDGLRDIGKLVTEEYFFTEVVDYTSEKKFLDISLPLTQSKYMVSYDGIISAGIDFSNITVEKDDSLKKITVAVPESEIISTEIEPESFKLFSEKEGLWNSISVEDYNDSLIELTKNAQAKALDRGILEKADENAKSVISNFVYSVLDSEGYTVDFIKK